MNSVGYFDTHAHYDDDRFAEEFSIENNGCRYEGTDGALRYVHDSGTDYICNVGASLSSSRMSLTLADRYPFVYAAVGLHPSDAQRIAPGMEEDALREIRDMAAHAKAVAIGEIGLDYHYDDTDRERQLWFFDHQLTLAESLGLPVIIHDRDAHGDTFDMLARHSAHGIIHSCSCSAEMARQYVGMGFYISFSGPLTYKNAARVRDACAAVPLDRLLLETDAPYLPPVPHRGELNHSDYIPLTAAVMAQLHGVSTEEMLSITRENGCRVYRIQDGL